MTIPPEWREEDPLLRADILKDWIGLLTQEYELAVSELFDPRFTRAAQ